MLNQRRRRRAPATRAMLGWLLVAVLYAAAAVLNVLLSIFTATWPPAVVGVASILLSGWSFLNALRGGVAEVTPGDQAVREEPALDTLSRFDHCP